MTTPFTPHSSDDALTRFLVRWAVGSQRRAGITVGLVLVLTVILAIYAASSLSFNVDPNALFSADLRFQQMIRKFSQHFPVLTDSLLIVIDGSTPEATRAAQNELAAALAKRTDVFHRVFLPGEEPFFERNGLLYASVDELDEFADDMALLQPIMGELTRDPSLPTLAHVVQTGLEETDQLGIDEARWEDILDRFRAGVVSVFDEFPVSISWESLILTDSRNTATSPRVVVADPILDLERVLAAETGIETVRETARTLGLGAQLGVRVRVSGYPALNHEEMVGLASDTTIAGILSFVLVVIVLLVAFRSMRLVLAAALTLLVGLVWSAAFGGAAVAELNPLSITFGILVIGLGVDFMIHLGMHFVDNVREGADVESAVARAVRDTGTALVLCAGTTAVGFLAFVPTDYRGVSDLGLLAAGGIVVILFQTLTFFPAAIRILVPPAALERLARSESGRGLSFPLPRRPLLVCMVAVLLAAAALPLVPRAELDTNVIRMRNPNTESVQAFEDLLRSDQSTPWYLDALVPSLEQADALAEQMRKPAGVDRALTLTDFVPSDQDEKREILEDISLFLDLPNAPPLKPVPAGEQIAALTTLRDFLSAEATSRGDSPLAVSLRGLGDALSRFLAQVEGNPHAAGRELATLQRVLIDPFPAEFKRLRDGLDAETITEQDLPPGLVSRMLSANGYARIQVYPSEDLWEHDAMVRFVETIRPIWGEITGLPVNLVESARATWASLLEALSWAALAITALLLALWRRPADTLMALGPLLLAVLLTQVSTVVLPFVSFNFVNVVVLPLLLGVGVDSGVHLVHRANQLSGATETLLSSTTARAVFFSAVTTIVSFGTLVISDHRGVSSLGALLVIGMLWTLAANLLLLPAMLSLRERRRTRRRDANRKGG